MQLKFLFQVYQILNNYLDLILLVVILEDILIINNVKYNVIPIGIKTTIPAKKLFLSLAKIEFFLFFFPFFMNLYTIKIIINIKIAISNLLFKIMKSNEI